MGEPNVPKDWRDEYDAVSSKHPSKRLAVGQLVRVPDSRTGVLVLIRNGVATVRMPSGQQLLVAPCNLKPVKR